MGWRWDGYSVHGRARQRNEPLHSFGHCSDLPKLWEWTSFVRCTRNWDRVLNKGIAGGVRQDELSRRGPLPDDEIPVNVEASFPEQFRQVTLALYSACVR
jgi:hypothetical protein